MVKLELRIRLEDEQVLVYKLRVNTYSMSHGQRRAIEKSARIIPANNFFSSVHHCIEKHFNQI